MLHIYTTITHQRYTSTQQSSSFFCSLITSFLVNGQVLLSFSIPLDSICLLHLRENLYWQTKALNLWTHFMHSWSLLLWTASLLAPIVSPRLQTFAQFQETSDSIICLGDNWLCLFANVWYLNLLPLSVYLLEHYISCAPNTCKTDRAWSLFLIKLQA